MHKILLLLIVVAVSAKEVHQTPRAFEKLEEASVRHAHLLRAHGSAPTKHKGTLILRVPGGMVTSTVYGRTSTIDPGTAQRIIDVVGQVSPSGKLGKTVILSSVAQAELVYDGKLATWVLLCFGRQNYSCKQVSLGLTMIITKSTFHLMVLLVGQFSSEI